MTLRNCDCPPNALITSWWDLQNTPPLNPFNLIAYAELNGTVGTFQYSTTYTTPSGPWAANPFTLSSTPQCKALGTDSAQNVADAAQWNFQHLTRNGSSNLAPPLQKLIFLRSGEEWKMDIPIDFGAQQYNDLQLSYRDNAGTRGDYAGSVPVISFTPGPFTGVMNLSVVLKQPGRVSMGLRAIQVGTGDYSMYESEWIIVP